MNRYFRIIISRTRAGLLAIGLLLGASFQANAQSTWIGPASGLWGTAANWDTGLVPNAVDAVVNINTASRVDVVNTGTGGTFPYTFGTINYSGSGNGSIGQTATSSRQVIAAVSSGTPAINVASGSNLYIYTLLYGTQGISFGGSGGWVLFSNNKLVQPFSGNVTIYAGTTVFILHDGNLGNFTNGITLVDSAIFAAYSSQQNGIVTLSPRRTITLAGSGGSAEFKTWGVSGSAMSIALIITGNINENSPGQGLLKNNFSSSYNSTSCGRLILAGTNTYTGMTSIPNQNSGTLQFAKEVSLYNNNHAYWTAAQFNVNNSTLAFNVGGPGEFTAGDLDLLLAGGGVVSSFQNSALALDTSSGNFNYSGIIPDPGNGSSLALVKIGLNKLTITATNTYSGGTSINAGTLSLGTNGQLPPHGITINSGGILDVSGYANATPMTGGDVTFNGSAGSAISAINGAANGNVILPGNLNSVTLNYDGVNPALVVSNSALTLNFPTLTVNDTNPLANGTYKLIQVNAGKIIQSGAYSVGGTAVGSATGIISFVTNSGIAYVTLTITGSSITGTTTTLNSNDLKAYGVSSVIQATVSPSPGTNGVMQFFLDGAPFSGVVNLSSGKATFPWPSSPIMSGPHKITAAFLGNSTNSPSAATGEVTLTVTNVLLSVTGAGVVSKAYDGTTAAIITNATLSGVLPGDSVFLENATTGTFATANPGTNLAVNSSMTLSGPAAANYTLILPTMTGTISNSPPTITVQPINQVVALGSNISFTVTALGPPPLSYQWQRNGASLTDNVHIIGSGSNILNIVHAAPVYAANYQVIITNAYGAVTSSVATLSVTTQKPEITWTNPAPILYGTALSTNQLNATAIVPGDFTYTPGIGTVLNAGVNSLSVLFTPTDTTNYSTATTNVTITVNKATPTITSAPTASAITYGQTLASSTLSGGAGSVPGNFAFTIPSTAPDAGNNSQSVTFIPTDSTNYNSANTNVSVSVSPASLTLTANNTNRFYGLTNPVFTGTIAGVQNGDNITAVYSTTATSNSPVGAYAIVPTLIDMNGRLANYTVNTNIGTLTIFASLPTILSLSPNSGTTNGGTRVSIIGTSLQEYELVKFGGSPASSVEYVNATNLIAVSPTGVLGWVNMSVTFTNGQTTTLSNSFLYTCTNLYEQNIGASILTTNDDGSTGPIHLPFTVSIYSKQYTDFWINNNGNVTFTGPLFNFTAFSFPNSNGAVIIAPFFADVDTRSNNGSVYYSTFSDHVAITWSQVGYFYGHAEKRNSFQLVISSPRTNGNFFVFSYDKMEWTTGDASGGSGGFGGSPARAGFDAGDNTNAVKYFEGNSKDSLTNLALKTFYYFSDGVQLQFNYPVGYNRISGQFLNSGVMRLFFIGNLGVYYALDRSFSLSPANWIPQATNLADASGAVVFTNTPNPATNNFWRVRSVP